MSGLRTFAEHLRKQLAAVESQIRDAELEKRKDSIDLELKFDLYGGLSYLKTLTLKFQ
jgi:hypothetical protein